MNTQLLEWYNLIFELPLGLALLYLAFYTISGWTFGDADSGVDSGLDHDVDAHLDLHGELAMDHDASIGHDLHMESDVGADTVTDTVTDTSDAAATDAHVDAHADADHNDAGSNSSPASAFLYLLNWCGVGRMPLSLVLMIFLLCWGSIGFCAMRIQEGGNLDRSIAVAVMVAGVIGISVTHFVSSVLGKALFQSGNLSRRRHELLGSLGEALYPIDATFGMVCGRDDRGELFQVACRTEKGQDVVEKGAAVQLVAYTAKERMFYVVPAASGKTPRRMSGAAAR